MGSALGCVLVDLSREELTAAATRAHVAALRDLLGPELPVDLRGPGAWPGPPVASLRPLPLDPGVRPAHAAGARALAAAAQRATAAGRPLLVLLGAVLPDSAAVEALLAGLACDPMVGTTQPRFAAGVGGELWSLPGAGTPGRLLPRRVLPFLPERYLLPEQLAACLLVRREVVAGFEVEPDAELELREALALELRRARRRGFRALVLNRVVVGADAPHDRLYPAARRSPVRERPEDGTDEAAALLASSPHLRFEPVVAAARRARPGAPLPVLLDCRGVAPFHNGTSEATLGLLDGIAAERPAWEVDALFRPEAAAYHQRRSSPGGPRIVTALPARIYAAAVRLDQPWHLSTIAELHRRACTVTFHMLDTIRWDVAGDRACDVDLAWRFIAERADGIAYNSAFTRERFDFRFPVAGDVVETVLLHAVDPPAAAEAPQADHVLVFGNDLAHKAVAWAVAVLRRGFPYQPLCAVGASLPAGPNLTVLPSGTLPAAEIRRLVSTARAVVFPSFYEGFGLPVVQALAAGRDVIVRASPLWREIAGLSRGPGRLLEFVAPHELVERVARVLEGDPPPGLPLGGALGDETGGAPPTWRSCARRLVEHVERTVAAFDGRRWYAREHALALAHV